MEGAVINVLPNIKLKEGTFIDRISVHDHFLKVIKLTLEIEHYIWDIVRQAEIDVKAVGRQQLSRVAGSGTGDRSIAYASSYVLMWLEPSSVVLWHTDLNLYRFQSL